MPPKSPTLVFQGVCAETPQMSGYFFTFNRIGSVSMLLYLIALDFPGHGRKLRTTKVLHESVRM